MPWEVFDTVHRQGSNDGKVNTRQRFCLLALWTSGMTTWPSNR